MYDLVPPYLLRVLLFVYLRSEVVEVLRAMQLCVILTTSCMFAGNTMRTVSIFALWHSQQLILHTNPAILLPHKSH